MSNRITKRDLDATLARLLRETGRPALAWTPRADGRGSECNIGALFIESGSQTYGRAWALCETMNAGGGQNAILRARTAQGLYDTMHAYLRGYEDARKVRS